MELDAIYGLNLSHTGESQVYKQGVKRSVFCFRQSPWWAK